MKLKPFIIILCTLFSLRIFSQNYVLQYPCLQDEGKLEESYLPKPYSVTKFPKKTKVKFILTKFLYEGKEYVVDFHYEGKIKYETNLLPLNDSLGLALKLSIAKTSTNGKNKYLYKIDIYKKDDTCWRSIVGGYTPYSIIYGQTMEMVGGGYASPGDKNYFRYLSGSLTLNNNR